MPQLFGCLFDDAAYTNGPKCYSIGAGTEAEVVVTSFELQSNPHISPPSNNTTKVV